MRTRYESKNSPALKVVKILFDITIIIVMRLPIPRMDLLSEAIEPNLVKNLTQGLLCLNTLTVW